MRHHTHLRVQVTLIGRIQESVTEFLNTIHHKYLQLIYSYLILILCTCCSTSPTPPWSLSLSCSLPHSLSFSIPPAYTLSLNRGSPHFTVSFKFYKWKSDIATSLAKCVENRIGRNGDGEKDWRGACYLRPDLLFDGRVVHPRYKGYSKGFSPLPRVSSACTSWKGADYYFTRTLLTLAYAWNRLIYRLEYWSMKISRLYFNHNFHDECRLVECNLRNRNNGFPYFKSVGSRFVCLFFAVVLHQCNQFFISSLPDGWRATCICVHWRL